MSGSELTPEARALLDAARRELSPTRADRDRVRKAIAVAAGGAAVVAAGATLAQAGGGAGAGAGATGIGAGAGASTLGGISLAVKVGIAITIVTVAATGTTVAVKMTASPSAQEVAAQQVARHHVAARPEQQRVEARLVAAPEGSQLAAPEGSQLAAPEGSQLAAPEGSQLAAPEATQAAAPGAQPLAVPSAARVPPSPGAPSLPVAPPHAHGVATSDRGVALAPPPPGATMPEPEEVTSTFDRESDLVREIYAAIDRHDAQTADARLEELGRLNPHTQFREDATVAGILLFCESHDVDRARAAAERFRAQYPLSSAARRLRGSCVDP